METSMVFENLEKNFTNKAPPGGQTSCQKSATFFHSNGSYRYLTQNYTAGISISMLTPCRLANIMFVRGTNHDNNGLAGL